jgi:hypothetical protein
MTSRSEKEARGSARNLVSVEELSRKAAFKRLGGACDDAWNHGLVGQIASALPESKGWLTDEGVTASKGALAGQVGIDPQDPMEGMIGAQMIAANAAALDLYRRAWIQEQTFEVATKYLALADKAARTVAMLAEALDRHRGRGQQQIIVKHVTVNADQAVVTDSVVNSQQAPGGGGDENQKTRQPHALVHAPGDPLQRALETHREAVPVARS